MAEITIGMPAPEAVNSPATVLTLASTWYAVAGSPINDEFLEAPRTRQLNETGR
jgi:hypothetical protein